MNTLQEAFHGYDTQVVPKDAGPVQRKETEQAFYAGALSVFQLMLKFSDHEENTAAQMLDTLNQEIVSRCDSFTE